VLAPPPQTFYSPFSGTTRVSRCQKENFWTLWRKGRLTEAATLTVRLGATPSRLTSAYLRHPPHIFYRPDALPVAQPTASKHWRAKATSAHVVENHPLDHILSWSTEYWGKECYSLYADFMPIPADIQMIYRWMSEYDQWWGFLKYCNYVRWLLYKICVNLQNYLHITHEKMK